MLSIPCAEINFVLGFAPIMAANGKERQFKQYGSAMLSDEIGALVLKFAKADDRPVAYVIRKLVEESPRIKAELRRNGKKR